MELVGNTFAFPWEAELMAWLQSRLPDAVISLISHLSFFGEELFIIMIVGFLYWSLDKGVAKKIGLTMLMINVWTPMIKNVALRRRPYFDHENIEIKRLVAPDADAMDISAQGYSLPSGHSANISGLTASLAAVYKKRWLTWTGVILTVLVGFSRVVVGAHYPTDVLAGWAIGLLAAWLVPMLSRRIPNRAILYGVLLLTALPGFLYCRGTDFFSGYGLLIGFLAGDYVEEKFVCFENTRSPWRAVLRVIGGAAVFFALNTLLKLPFSSAFLSGGTYPALLVRCARYAVAAFVCFALYPIIFRYTARIGR